MSTGEKIAAGFLFAAALWIPFVMMVVEPLLALVRAALDRDKND